MVPVMYTEVTFPSRSRGIAQLTQSEDDCAANKPLLTETAVTGMQQGRGSRGEKHRCHTRKRPHPRMEKPPALLLQYWVINIPVFHSNSKYENCSGFHAENPHSPPSAHAEVLLCHCCPGQQQKSRSEICQLTTKCVPCRPPCSRGAHQLIYQTRVILIRAVYTDFFFPKFLHLLPKLDT